MPNSKSTVDWDEKKKEADAKTAAEEARKAEAEARLAWLKAQIGEIQASDVQGKVDLNNSPGAIEAALLAANAVRSAAERIAIAVRDVNPKEGVLLYGNSEVPDFGSLLAFRTQTKLIEKVFDEAQKASIAAGQTVPSAPGSKAEVVPVLGAIGLGVEAVNNLLSYFRTDYSVAGVEVNMEDSILLHTVAGAILRIIKNIDVLLPSSYCPEAISDAGDGILSELEKLASLRARAPNNSSDHAGSSERPNVQSLEETKTDTGILEKAERDKKAGDLWKAASSLYDAFFAKLTAPDDKGAVPLTNIIREGAVAELLSKGRFLLVLKLQKSGGAYYTKRNLWSLFSPGIPLYHMGGIVASYVLLDGKRGNVLTADAIPVHGGFIKASDLSKQFTERETCQCS